MLGGNSVHAATAVVAAGATAALVARRGEDFPPEALAALAAEGIDADRPGRRPRPDRAQLGDLRGGRAAALALPDAAGTVG